MSRKVDFAFARRIARCLRAERLSRGLSVRQLSQMSGLAPTTIYNAESGQYEPLASTVIRIARVYGISLDLLFGEIN